VPKEFRVTVDSHLRFERRAISHALLTEITRELTLDNPAYIEAKDRGYSLKDIIPRFELIERWGEVVVLPRGYALRLKQLARAHGYRVRWRNKRTWQRGKPLGKEEFAYRVHQPRIVDEMRKHQQGVYKAPTGSGKTVTVCGYIWEEQPESSLILTDRINLVTQWIDRIHEHIGEDVEVGKIGEGIWDWQDQRIVVALVQSLYSRMEELDANNFFMGWDAVFLDECHHATADMYRFLFTRFSARDRIGVSATPDKTGLYDLIERVIGPVFAETTQDELRELGLLVEPHVEVVRTEFDFTYWGDHTADKDGDCEVPWCKNPKPFHRHRNNYQKLLGALIDNRARNNLIAKKIYKNRHRTQLVITDRVKQIDAMEDALTEYLSGSESIFRLTGKEKDAERQRVIRHAQKNPCVIFSTIAGEALDISTVDTIHLVWPTRNPRKVEQNIGRGTRKLAGKGDVVVYDYTDTTVPVLAQQFRTRRWKAYEPLGLKVILP
jgi:superfamily II DNA or RNA helicase